MEISNMGVTISPKAGATKDEDCIYATPCPDAHRIGNFCWYGHLLKYGDRVWESKEEIEQTLRLDPDGDPKAKPPQGEVAWPMGCNLDKLVEGGAMTIDPQGKIQLSEKSRNPPTGEEAEKFIREVLSNQP